MYFTLLQFGDVSVISHVVQLRTTNVSCAQFAYRLCKEAASQKISQTIEQLFTVSEDRSRKDVLAEISRVYGQLLHVSGLKNDEKICRDVCSKVSTSIRI